ncbi:Reverse transcriptase (RNA-dependent DNA polymerase) [Nesidiocoris tenuis]|nr:Reverse transcriptase (RNA-dependent DNA polymerase) [Nesidiocoris tenuis]
MTTEGNAIENWNFFKDEWQNYVIASGLDKKDEGVRVATLKCLLGRETSQILKNLKLTDQQLGQATEIISALDGFFLPAVNVIYERYVFGSAAQNESEKIDQYVARLRHLSSTCEYKAMEDEMIRDRLVLGIRDEETKKQLLSDPKLTLTSAIRTCRVNELASAQMKTIIHSPGVSEQVSKVTSRNRQRTRPKNSERRSPKQVRCKYCGSYHKHDRRSCPAHGQQCRRCKKYDHFEAVCETASSQGRKSSKFHRPVKQLEEEDDTGSEASDRSYLSSDMFKIEALNTVNGKAKRKWVAKLDFFCEDQVKSIECQLDSGATINVVDISVLRKAFGKRAKVKPSDTTIRCFGGTTIKPIGETTIAVASKQASCDLIFQVVSNSSKGSEIPLISAESCEKLGLVKLTQDVKLVRVDDSAEDIMRKYKHVFTGVGCLEGEISLSVDPSVEPVKQKPRRIPVPLRDEVKQKLDEMVKHQIIAKETGPTDWTSNLVIVKTPKKLRLCLDPLYLNQALRRTEYEIPTIESVLPELNGARYFSVVDTKDGFWNIKLDEKSSKLTTFWTPFGRYRFLRLPFGLNVSTDIYQCRLHEVFAGIKDTIVIQDDILVIGRGKNDEEASRNHDRVLEELLERAKQANLKFNKEKVKLKQRSVRYMGHIITSEGLKADPSIKEAIKQMKYPMDVTEVKSFIGMATYLSKFVPHLTALCEPLRILTKKDQEWVFGEEQKRAVDRVKAVISESPVLAYFDPKKPIVLQSDASCKGLGAVIMQNGRPVAYASRSLRDSERNFAQIEKECLSILFACERFSQFIVGCGKITAFTDHRPLETIFKKSILKAPTRLQRMMMRLQRYNLDVKFISGSKMHLADALSRMQLSDSMQESRLDEVYAADDIYEELESIQIPDNLNISQVSLSRVRQETATDDTLPLLASVIKEGWPATKDRLPASLCEFWDYKHELIVQNGIVFKGDKIVVPRALRSEFIKKIHLCHLGQSASIRRARDTLYWPSMTAQIKDTIRSCSTCQELAPSQAKTPMKSHEIPSLPWERVSMDTFEFEKKQFIVLVDSYSDYFEIGKLPNITAQALIKFCKKQFGRHGIPQVLVSDNAPQMIGSEFRHFAKEWEFLHSTSSPHHSRGNGKAESAVKIAKTMMKKCKKDKSDFDAALLEWRNTPTEGMSSSPVQRLMSRRTRTRIPTSDKLLIPEVVPEVQDMITNKRRRSKYHYDKTAKPLPRLEIGQNVLVRSTDRKTWTRGEIESAQGHGASYNVNVDGKTFRRDRTWLKPDQSPPRLPRTSVKVQQASPSPNRERLSPARAAETTRGRCSNATQTSPKASTSPPKSKGSSTPKESSNTPTVPGTSKPRPSSSAPKERPAVSKYGRKLVQTRKLVYKD